MTQQLYTKWGERLDPDHVLEEYPRPGMVRDSYLNLNGKWEYAITGKAEAPGNFDGTILVPFSPECVLSGVGRQLGPKEYLHYRRTVFLKKEFLIGRCLLHFGAVDQSCTVYVNGNRAGVHAGGYLPFTLEVTDFVHPGENELYVCVKDPSDTSYHARGKQKLKNGGMWYTAQSGIWQTVWMECVPQVYISSLKITPDYDAGSVSVRVFLRGEETADGERADGAGHVNVQVRVERKGEIIAIRNFPAGTAQAIPLGTFAGWTPEQPNLYDLIISAGKDRVTSYFGMRKLEVRKDRKGILRFFLNNRPYYQNGLLDQGYYPDGLYTAPTDEALASDIIRMKELGFNMLRKHIKIEPERWYYHCDRLGMLVWQDMVNGGSRYNMTWICTLPNVFPILGRVGGDGKAWYRIMARKDAAGREEYRRELKGMIRSLYNHPSIAAWVPFNEGWGQFDASGASALVRRLDGTRLVDEASGWFDRGGGDMYSIHNYFRKLKVRPRRSRVTALTEFGGYSFRADGRSYSDKVYGYRKFSSDEELTEALRELWEKELIPAVKNGLGASVYTQVSDVEEEVNGLLTWDRTLCKAAPDVMREENRRLAEAFRRSTEEKHDL